MSEFYVGYRDRAPAATAAFVRRTVLGLGLLALAVALTIVVRIPDGDIAFFEFGRPRTFVGTVVDRPAPGLEVTLPGDSTGKGVTFLLAVFGKQGAEPAIEGFIGRRVRLDGTLAYRSGAAMLEIVPGSIHLDEEGPSAARLTEESLATLTLRGEIVGSKCWTGVMNPGRGKVHRSCAARCIAGGVPAFLVAVGDGERQPVLLTNLDGEPLRDEVLDVVGETVEFSGRATRRGGLWTLAVDPADLDFASRRPPA